MTISSSLSAGVAGLAANANRLATISDNIANSATHGYRRAVTDFHSMVINSGTTVYTAGGVRTTNQRMISEGGQLVSTSNPTDLAVRGRGMIPVTNLASLTEDTGQPTTRFVTTGSFRTNAEGYLTTAGGKVLMGWPAKPDGTVPKFPQDSFSGLKPVKINKREYSGVPTSKVALNGNLPATESMAGASGDPRTMSVEYFDNLAKSQTLNIEFVPNVPATGESNQWQLVIRDGASGGAVVGEYTIQFDNTVANGGTIASVTTVSGGAYDPATGAMTITTASGPLEMNIGMPLERSRISQISDRYAPGETKKDGYPAGSLSGLEVDQNGNVKASYDNGITRTIFQVPLVDVPNQDGLNVHDDQTYSLSHRSGQFMLWPVGEGPIGDIMSYAREASATDVAKELTDLIQTQRAYSSNAKIIQTVDDMLQETTNMKR